MEEAREEPPYFVLPNEYFTIFENGRQRLLSGRQPAELEGQRGIQARAWRAYQNRTAEPPAWERAERYRDMMHEGGYRSVRALARALGEDHSRVARLLKVLDLPESALEVLRCRSADARVRAHFTEKRLRQVAKGRDEAAIVREIEQVIQAGG